MSKTIKRHWAGKRCKPHFIVSLSTTKRVLLAELPVHIFHLTAHWITSSSPLPDTCRTLCMQMFSNFNLSLNDLIRHVQVRASFVVGVILRCHLSYFLYISVYCLFEFPLGTRPERNPIWTVASSLNIYFDTSLLCL